MTEKVFQRLSDKGHASIFKSRISGGFVTIELHHPFAMRSTTAILSKEDALRFSEWLQIKCKDKS